jgi:hypothetical protein
MWQDMVRAIPWPSPKPDLRIIWDLSHTFDDRSSSATVLGDDGVCLRAGAMEMGGA